MNYSSIDIFCHRIDNYGDVGVTYRFAKEFKAARPDCRVRVFVDDMEALHAIAHGIDPTKDTQEYESITYINTLSLPPSPSPNESTININTSAPIVADVMVEMFACHIPKPFLEMAYARSKLIINIEYLSAEDWVEGYHLKESLLGRGGAIRKFYFMPGFREGTGGLIINSRLERERALCVGVDRPTFIESLVGGLGVGVNVDGGDDGGDGDDGDDRGDEPIIGTIFTYERGFDALISSLAGVGRRALLLVFGDKSHRGMAAAINRLSGGSGRHQPTVYKNVNIVYMPFISQHSYDTLLCYADFNVVRGEDSLARAVLSGKPFIWNAYVQEEKYQLVKVEALLETMRPYYEELFGDDNHSQTDSGERFADHPTDLDPSGIFAAYRALMLKFNDSPTGGADSEEGYCDFFKNLKKHERVASAMYYFMVRNCDLIAKFRDFLDNYTVPA